MLDVRRPTWVSAWSGPAPTRRFWGNPREEVWYTDGNGDEDCEGQYNDVRTSETRARAIWRCH